MSNSIALQATIKDVQPINYIFFYYFSIILTALPIIYKPKT